MRSFLSKLRKILSLVRGALHGKVPCQMPPQTKQAPEGGRIMTVDIPEADLQRSAVDVLIGRRDPFPELDRSGIKPKDDSGTKP
jgi:hypothetical protein